MASTSSPTGPTTGRFAYIFNQPWQTVRASLPKLAKISKLSAINRRWKRRRDKQHQATEDTGFGIGTRDKNTAWYIAGQPLLTPTRLALFANYKPTSALSATRPDGSNAVSTPTNDQKAEEASLKNSTENKNESSPSELSPLEKHISDIRDKAWEIYPYPCVGLYSFLDVSVSGLSIYWSTILPRVRAPSKSIFLDLGCSFGQDIRQLIIDGADPTNLIGADLHAGYIQLGYELFNDGPNSANPLTARFESGDVFDPNFLTDMVGKVDIIYIGALLHLFSFDDQVVAGNHLEKLLSKNRGSLIVGRQTGKIEAGDFLLYRSGAREVQEDAAKERRSNSEDGMVFWHNEESFHRMWSKIGDGRWKVDVTMESFPDEIMPKDGELAKRSERHMRFVVERL